VKGYVGRSIALGVAAALALLFSADFLTSAASQKKSKQVIIYDDYPTNSKDPTATYYAFEMYMPAEAAFDIAVRRDFPAGDLVKDAKGTCMEVQFNFGGADEWCAVAYKPAGAKLGEKAGFDIENQLAIGPGQHVYLKFKARRKSNSKAIVTFRCGGLGAGAHFDKIKPAVTSNPKKIELTADWVEYQIDLTEHVAGLSSVLSPFSVYAQSNDHPNQKQIVFYLDDIRIVTE
jgi:hypothetical protein